MDPRLDGRYVLRAMVGKGTAGVVFRAERVSDGEVVAVKTLSLPHGPDQRAEQRCRREIEVLRQLSHPAVPAYVDDFFTGRGGSRKLHLVQRFVEGETLAEELTHRRYTESEVLEIVRELAMILSDLHGLSPPVIHRDVKPGNVMRGRIHGQPGPTSLFLVDFGAVRDALRDPSLGGSTVAGTFGYMAPEQFRGDAGPATDAYGLGALAIVLLTRREPATLMDWGGRLRWEAALGLSPTGSRSPSNVVDLPSQPLVTSPTAELLTHLLNPDPELRITSLARVADACVRIGAGGKSGLHPQPAPQATRRARWFVAASFLTLGALAYAAAARLPAGPPPMGSHPVPAPPQPPGLVTPHPTGPKPALPTDPPPAPQIVVPPMATEDTAVCAVNNLIALHSAQRAHDAAFDRYTVDAKELGWEPDIRCRWYGAYRLETASAPVFSAIMVVTRGDAFGRSFRITQEGTVTETARRTREQVEDDLQQSDRWFGNLPDGTGPDGWTWTPPQ